MRSRHAMWVTPAVQLETLTIYGAGLIGGSVLLAQRRAELARRVILIARKPRPSTPEFQQKNEIWISSSDHASVERAFQESELILLATPVRSIMEELPRALSSQATVTDCGSTKQTILEVARACPNRAQFVPGHPMAGHPVGGLSHARADLFDGKRWLLCPEQSSPKARDLMREFVTALGANPVELSASAHDHGVAITSHLPQLIGSALSLLAENEGTKNTAGPGFASATRVAGGPENIWRDIFETNHQEISRALLALCEKLHAVGQSLAEANPEPALELLQEARDLRSMIEASR